MSASLAEYLDAASQGDASQLRSLLVDSELLLLSTSGSDEGEDGDLGAIVAEIEDTEVLVVFTTEQAARDFVAENGELFEEDEEVDAIVVEGKALIDYLPDEYGILFDPVSDDSILIEPDLVREVKELNA